MVIHPAFGGELDGNATRADAAFTQARALMAEGRTAEACARFEESQRLLPRTGTLLNLGLCHEAAGDAVSAYRELAAAEEQVERSASPDSDVNAARRKLAREHLDALAPKIGRILVEPAERSDALLVRLDGVDLPASVLGKPFAVAPGTHTLQAGTSAKLGWESTLAVQAGGEPVRWVIPALRGAAGGGTGDPPEAAPPPGTASPDERAGAAPATTGMLAPSVRATLPPSGSASSAAAAEAPAPRSGAWPPPGGAIAAAGGAAVAIALGAVLGGMSLKARADAQALCTPVSCGEDALSAFRSQRTLAVGADVAFGVGVAAVAVSGMLWLLDRNRSAAPGGSPAPRTGAAAGAERSRPSRTGAVTGVF
jgi:hypothetical protein